MLLDSSVSVLEADDQDRKQISRKLESLRRLSSLNMDSNSEPCFMSHSNQLSSKLLNLEGNGDVNAEGSGMSAIQNYGTQPGKPHNEPESGFDGDDRLKISGTVSEEDRNESRSDGIDQLDVSGTEPEEQHAVCGSDTDQQNISGTEPEEQHALCGSDTDQQNISGTEPEEQHGEVRPCGSGTDQRNISETIPEGDHDYLHSVSTDADHLNLSETIPEEGHEESSSADTDVKDLYFSQTLFKEEREELRPPRSDTHHSKISGPQYEENVRNTSEGVDEVDFVGPRVCAAAAKTLGETPGLCQKVNSRKDLGLASSLKSATEDLGKDRHNVLSQRLKITRVCSLSDRRVCTTGKPLVPYPVPFDSSYEDLSQSPDTVCREARATETSVEAVAVVDEERHRFPPKDSCRWMSSCKKEGDRRDEAECRPPQGGPQECRDHPAEKRRLRQDSARVHVSPSVECHRGGGVGVIRPMEYRTCSGSECGEPSHKRSRFLCLQGESPILKCGCVRPGSGLFKVRGYIVDVEPQLSSSSLDLLCGVCPKCYSRTRYTMIKYLQPLRIEQLCHVCSLKTGRDVFLRLELFAKFTVREENNSSTKYEAILGDKIKRKLEYCSVVDYICNPRTREHIWATYKKLGSCNNFLMLFYFGKYEGGGLVLEDIKVPGQ